MAVAFRIDGIEYPGVIVPEDGIKRSFAVLDGPNVGRTLSGGMVRDIIGTYYNYTVELDTTHTSRNDYDRLYEALSAPIEFHTIAIPYAQDVLTFTAYVANGEDTLRKIGPDGNHWHGLSITFTAMEPARRPGGV